MAPRLPRPLHPQWLRVLQPEQLRVQVQFKGLELGSPQTTRPVAVAAVEAGL